MFEEPSAGWPTTRMTQNAELTASDALGGTTLGVDGVAISGSTIIGATNEGSTSTEYGAGYVFTEPAGGWPATMTQTQKLLPTPLGGAFASAVGLSGGTAVLGAPNALQGIVDFGAAYVFGPGTTTTATTTTPTTTTTATTTTTPTTTKPTTSAVGAGASGHASVSGESASVKATCAGAAAATCKLTDSLASRDTVENGKPVAVAASPGNRSRESDLNTEGHLPRTKGQEEQEVNRSAPCA